jgi:hypothetical protein
VEGDNVMADWNGAPNPGLDARIEGSELFVAPAGAKTDFYIYFTFACDFQGMEFFAWNSNIGDNIDLRTDYYVPPMGVWKRYKKFGKHFNIYPNNVTKVILFPTKPTIGVRMTISYDNKGTEPVSFSMNKFQFADIEKVDTSVVGEGEDW